MEDAAFSDEFCSFIQTTVTSVAAAEMLLLLANDSGRAWQLDELLGHLKPDNSFTAADAGKCLDLLKTRGIVKGGADGLFQYDGSLADMDALVRTLAQAYKERPVTLIRIIYALRDHKIRSFADAFKFRKD